MPLLLDLFYTQRCVVVYECLHREEGESEGRRHSSADHHQDTERPNEPTSLEAINQPLESNGTG